MPDLDGTNLSSSTVGDSSDTINTITILDKTSSVMDGCQLQNSFYREQIYGDQFDEETVPFPDATHSVPRQPVVTIDPIVRNKSASPSSGPSVSVGCNGYRERLYSHGKLTKHEPTNNRISSAQSTGMISSAPTSARHQGFTQNQNAYPMNDKQKQSSTVDKKLSVRNNSLDRLTQSDFYSLEEGLNWQSQVFNDEYQEQGLVGKHPAPKRQSPQSPSQLQRPKSQPRLNQMPARQPSYEMIPHPFANASAHFRRTIVEEPEMQNNQYKTVLYVVPNSPTEEDDPQQYNSKHADHNNRPRSRETHQSRALNQEKHEHGSVNNRNNPVLNGTGNVHCDQPTSLNDYISQPDSYQQSSVRSIDASTGLLTEPSRYESNRYDSENKPYYQTLPSPRHMAVTMPLNGYHTLPHKSMEPIVQPTTIRLARTDYNQVVVDIKPRQLNEADKQQHVSQWIQVGTLGDTVSSQVGEQSDSMLEDGERSDVIQPLAFDDFTDQEVSPEDDAPVHQITPHPMCRTPETERSTIQDHSLPHPSGSDKWTPVLLHASHKRDPLETGIEDPGTPETLLTSNSIKSNIVVSVGGQKSMSPVKKIYEGQLVDPTPEYYAETAVIPLVPRAHTPERRSPERVITIKSNPTTPQPYDNTDGHDYEQSTTFSSHGKSTTSRLTRTQSERRYRPQVAPKPTVQEQLAAILDRRPMTTTGAEIRYMNSKVSSRLSQSHFMNCTFPRYVNWHSRPVLDTYDWSTDEKYLETARDTPVPNVRNLTAYFSELIERQNDTHGSITSVRSGDYSEVNGFDERGTPFTASPFLSHRETPEERKRRLKVVENLRSRTMNFNIDSNRTRSRLDIKDSTGGAAEDFYPYCRPMSAPKTKPMTYITTHVIRGTTPVSDGT